MRSAGWTLLLMTPGCAGLLLPSIHARPLQWRRHPAVRCGLPTGWKEVTDPQSGKPYFYNAATGVTQWQKPVDQNRFAGEGDGSERTLTPSSTWRIKLDLEANGVTATVQASLRFAEDEGYEPPQGVLLVESCIPEGALALGEQPARWLLSEDPEDRKDSLWIWGLFSQPLYPFILLQLELARPFELADGIAIPAGPLYCQIDHRRTKTGAVQLGEGAVTYKVQEKIKADLVGLSEVVYGEPTACGTLRFLDTADDMQKSYV